MPTPEIDSLLAEDAWLRRLAWSLTQDAAVADDLVQETWVAALTQPAAARSRRAWLRGTLRNLWRELLRGDGRRADRERCSARREPVTPTDELVSELSLRRSVVDGLLQLEEPYRTVLFRRFFKGESLKRIASDQGVAVSTVHARLQRGLERMRERLDDSHGGNRSAWALGLTSFAEPLGGVGVTLTGGLAMGTAIKFGAAAAVVVATVSVWMRMQPEEQEPVEDSVVAAAHATNADEEAPAEVVLETTELDSGERGVVEETRETAQDEASPSLATIGGRLVDMNGAAVGGAALRFVAGEDTVAEATSEVIAGSFTMEVPLGTDLGAGKFELVHPTLQLLVDTGNAEEPLLLVAGPRLRFAGVVLDPEGAPVPGAEVTVRLRHALYRDLGLKHDFDSDLERWSTVTGTDGGFELHEAVGGSHSFLHVEKLGFGDARSDLPVYDELGMTITLAPLERVFQVTGLVLDPEGAPFEGASVSLGTEIVESDEAGRFSLKWDPELLRDQQVERGADGVWRRKKGESHVAAVAAGYAPARTKLTETLVTEPVTLRLGAQPLVIAGRVLDEEGEPLPGVQLWVCDPTHFGHVTYTAGESIARSSVTLEGRLSGDRGTITDDEGRFQLAGLDERAYDVQAFDPSSASYGARWTLQAGTEDVELRLNRDASSTLVAGRVVSRSGKPHVGLRLRPIRPTGQGYNAEPPQSWSGAAETNEAGRFVFPKLAVEGTRLELLGDGVFYHHVDLAEHADLGELEIVVPLLCELRLTLRDASLADAFQVLDELGEPLDLYVHQGAFISMTETGELTEGKSSVLEVNEYATSVRLLREGEEVGLMPIQVTPDGRSELEL